MEEFVKKLPPSLRVAAKKAVQEWVNGKLTLSVLTENHMQFTTGNAYIRFIRRSNEPTNL